tara:strand:+ start:442 stop:606 length:165 start_codon:yes stop_codon:yes gene_type:complete
MSFTYKLIKNDLTNKINTVLRKEDNSFIPFDEDNIDYQAYLAWVAEGNTAEAAD